MLEQMRKHMNWMMWTILALIIVTFLFFGIYPSDSTGRMVAKVNGDVITYDEWNRAYQTLSENYRQIFKEQFNEGLQKIARGRSWLSRRSARGGSSTRRSTSTIWTA